MHHPDDVKSIFLEAVERVPPDQWPEFLRQTCAGDEALLGRVQELLDAHAAGGEFMATPAAPVSPEAAGEGERLAERPGQTIGRYRLLQEIGEGGFGVVYLAEQQEPVRRNVAVKIIKPGMDTRAVVARFEAERQALAMMDHPNIARVYDAGATDSGRPYFVMDLVEGVPLTEYCDRQNLSTRQRLELFGQVCQAVQHAHQKGIIHRDLKPAHVLVAPGEDRPVLKIIDFGIAKATHGRLLETAFLTAADQLIGTPLYMSPEQAEIGGADMDTRSDIYSLGVMLYELLTGHTPFDEAWARAAGLDEVRRLIREIQPPRPSTRITVSDESSATIAARRQTEPRKLRLLLRGDLDWIVMKALEKDRSRRYQTAGDLARDIERYLNDEPVEARPPTLADRIGKWARRHRPVLWSAGVLLVLSTIGLSLSTLMIARQRAEAVRAYEETARQLQATSRAERLAETQMHLAEKQEKEAIRQRNVAEHARYASDMRLALYHWTTGESTRLLERLHAQIPLSGRPDLRGWEWYYLFSQTHNDRLAFPFQSSNALAWSPDGESLATVDWLGGVNLWDASTGKRRRILKDCVGQNSLIAWSPDGKHIAAIDHDVAWIWDAASGDLLRSLQGHAGPCYALDWNPDGARLATGGTDGTIRVWSAQTGKQLSSLTVPGKVIWCVDWHPDGKQLLGVVGIDPNIAEEVRIWDTSSGKQVGGWSATWVNQQYAAFSPDGDRVVWSYRPARVSDWRTGRLISSFPRCRMGNTAWSPDGRRLASPTIDGQVDLWDPETGATLLSLPAPAVSGGHIAWNPNGSLLAVGCEGPKVAVWEVDSSRQALALPTGKGYALAVRFSPDGRRLLVGGRKGLVDVYDSQSGKATLSVEQDLTWIRCVAWSPDGKRFATPANTASVVVRDAETGSQPFPLLPCEGEIRSLAWSPDGEVLAAGTRKGQSSGSIGPGRVVLFSMTTGKEVAASPYAEWSCDSIAWRPDGQRLAASGKRLRVWDATLREEIPAATSAAVVLDWSPDGKQLAVAGGNGPDHGDGNIRIYDATSWKVIVEMTQGVDDVASLAWNPRMPRLASGSQDGVIKIWDTATGQEVFLLEPAADTAQRRIQQLAWSPDGLQLAAASRDCTVRVWDASNADRVITQEQLRAQRESLIAQKKFAEVIDRVRSLWVVDPENWELEVVLQRAIRAWVGQLAGEGDLDRAVAVYRQLSAEILGRFDYRLWMSTALFGAGDQEKAVEMLEELLAERPGHLAYRHAVAVRYETWATRLLRERRWEPMIPLLERLAQEFPERPDFRVQLAWHAAASKCLNEAMAALDKIAKARSRWPDYRPELARRLEGSHSADAAVVYSQLLADSPAVAEYREGFFRSLPLWWAARASRKDSDLVIDGLRQLLRSAETARAMLDWVSCELPVLARGAESLPGIVFVSDMPWVRSTCGWGLAEAMRDRLPWGGAISIAGLPYANGICTWPFDDERPADVVVDVSKQNFATFKAHVGMRSTEGSVQFQVCVDGKVKQETPVLRAGMLQPVCVPVEGAQEVTLRVLNGGDGNKHDDATWGLARFVEAGANDPLEQPGEIRTATEANVALLMAEVHSRLDNKDLARRWFDAGAEWMDKNPAEAERLNDCRVETEQTLGSAEKLSAAKEKPKAK